MKEPADGAGRVEAVGAAVLALFAYASRAREQAKLHVFAEGGLGELHALGGEKFDDLGSGDALRELLFQRVVFVGFALRHCHLGSFNGIA